MRIILLIAVVGIVGCSKSPKPDVDPNENAAMTLEGTRAIKSDVNWPVMFTSGHLVVSVYPPVASKVKLEVENRKGDWSPMDQSDPLASEVMMVVAYRVSNISHKEAFAIDDTVTIVCKLVDWRNTDRFVGSLDYYSDGVTLGRPLRIVAPADGYLGGVVQLRPFELAAGRSVAGAAAFRAVDIATLSDGDDKNLAVACFALSDSTGDQAAAVVDIPADFVVPKNLGNAD